MILPDHSDIADAEVDYLAQRAEIPLPTKAGELNTQNASVYPSVTKAVADAQPIPLGKPIAAWQVALIVAAPGVVILAGWLIARAIDLLCWNLGRAWGSLC